ncbi:unnamed protein product [Bursaphelenchus okinawaensis]|uniref:Uncharacterized protein n=1 Tax=Bursaphelenchus okinawaensis TaxID=465554 RepID=A0A811LDK7_9BILA|nr:unnamed protein product [Bursaphelenchus okinawaensis]CAG9123326.1 unnamed protein product [Bursaphelenchus okinawaensis]
MVGWLQLLVYMSLSTMVYAELRHDDHDDRFAIQSYRFGFHKELKNANQCFADTSICIQYRKGTVRLDLSVYNPCLEFAETCLGIPVEDFVEVLGIEYGELPHDVDWNVII